MQNVDLVLVIVAILCWLAASINFPPDGKPNLWYVGWALLALTLITP